MSATLAGLIDAPARRRPGRPAVLDGAAAVPIAARLHAREVADLLDARCLAAIAGHKRPRECVVRVELPRNPAGKVLETVLRDAVAPTREVAP